jgi:hypothetical protein
MECLWTSHAEERQQGWQTKLGVTREKDEEVVRHKALYNILYTGGE